LGAIAVSFPATIAAPRNTVVGSVISSVTIPVPGATAGFKFATCTGSEPMYWQIKTGPVVANRVGATSVAGVGYTVWMSGGGFSGDVVMDSTWNNSVAPGGGTSPTFQSQLYVTVNLVVTGQVAGGSLAFNPGGGVGLPDQIAQFFVDNRGGTLFTVNSSANASAITASACSVTTPSISVDLQSVNASAFQQVGDTAGSQATSINLNCPASTIRIFVTLTDSSNPTNISNILSLKQESTAQGVGLQILTDGKPVSFGPDSSAAGNTNQWFVGASSGGPVSIPLVVQYIRTASVIRPGSANGAATFTMSYQ
jgi:type 1 fimbria pilin